MDKNNFLELCDLSCIYIEPENASDYVENLNVVESYINMLDELDLDGVDITIWSENAQMVLREDVPTESFNKEEILQNAPKEAYGYFALDNIME